MLIKNGFVVTAQGVLSADVRTDGEIISQISPNLAPLENEHVVDAMGKYILPGGVDVHTHFDLDLGFVKVTDDFYTGTVAAAFGGTTSIVDHMGFGPRGCSITDQIEHYHKLAVDKAVIDYSFHGVLDHVDENIIAELETLIAKGITSHKFYLTYGGKISDQEVMMLMEKSAQLGIMLTVHCENDGSIAWLREKYQKSGDIANQLNHAKSRPIEAEAEAIARMILFAKMSGDAPLYIVHLSEYLGLDIIKAARNLGQKNIFAETCPQYLLLDESMYSRYDALKYIMSPPLRTKENNNALWQGLANGHINTIATDHCTFFYEKEKQMGKDDFTKAPGGAPGVEARMALIYSQGVAKGLITIEQFVETCCTNPAKLFGLYPKKGELMVGADADIVVFDQNKKQKLTFDLLHENTDYTPYEGVELTGWPVITISRGEIIVQEGKLNAKNGRGKFIARGMPILDL